MDLTELEARLAMLAPACQEYEDICAALDLDYLVAEGFIRIKNGSLYEERLLP